MCSAEVPLPGLGDMHAARSMTEDSPGHESASWEDEVDHGRETDERWT